MHSEKRPRKYQSDRIEQGNLMPSNSESLIPKIVLTKHRPKNSPFSSSKKKKTQHIINNKIISIPLLKGDNFFNIIQSFTKYENALTNKNKNITKNNFINSNLNQENDLLNSSRTTQKVEILEDGSVCIKNTSGMISPSYNIDNKNMNHENENEFLTNSKLLISNNIKVLEDDIDENGYQTVNENNIFNRKHNIFKIDDFNNSYNKESNTTLDENNNYGNNFNFSIIKVPNGVYCSSIKKKKIDEIKNNKICKTTVRKKVILNPKKSDKDITINNKKNLFCDKFKEQENIDILNDWKYFVNKIRNDYNNKNNFFHSKLKKKILIIKNLKPYNFSNINTNTNRNAIGNIFTFNNNYNNYIRYIENSIEPENEVSSKIINSFNNDNNNLPDNSLGSVSINNSNQNIVSFYNENNTQKSIAEFNENENSTDSEYEYQATNIRGVLNMPIINNNENYENIFNEVILLSEENLNNEEKMGKNNNKKKYNKEIEAIQENINESSEDQESIYIDNTNKISNINDIINDDNFKDNDFNNNNFKSKKIMKISLPIIDDFKINIWNKFSTDLNLIYKKFDNLQINNNQKQSITKKEKIKIKNNLKIIKENSIDYSDSNRKLTSIIRCDESDDVSVSVTRTEVEISDDEKIDDETKEKNLLQKNNPFIIFNIISNENNKIKIRFFENIENNVNSNKISQIKIQSYLKILRLIFSAKKRKPISKFSYENLISIFINNLYFYRDQFIFNKKTNINEKNNLTLKEKLKDCCIEIDKTIKIFDKKLSELKNDYLYTLVKKHYIKDKIQKKKFIKEMGISGKRNEVKKIYKNICFILNNKINVTNIKKNYIDKIINLLKLYDKISEKDLHEMKQIIKNEMNNKNKENKNEEKREEKKEIKKEKNKMETKKLFAFMIPVMFIANYLMNNIKDLI